MTESRRARHDEVAAVLAGCDDADLAALVATGRDGGLGVGGGCATLDVGGVPVFVKRIPLTDRELARPYSTANLFDLPTFCQYGLGGPGFNAWRELAANLIVTDVVLSGGTRSFPLLHHWRVLPGRPAVPDEHVDVDATVAAHDGHPAVRARLDALAAASSSLVLFSEYLPDPVQRWLRDDPVAKAEAFERQLAEIVAALRGRDLLHMDGHLGNLRADGERVYLTDFGLATSPRFDLSPAEREFVARNVTHDADYAAMRLVNWLVTEICGVPVSADAPPVARNDYVLQCARGDIPDGVGPEVRAILTRNAPAAARMNSFYWRLFGGEVHAEYPAA